MNTRLEYSVPTRKGTPLGPLPLKQPQAVGYPPLFIKSGALKEPVEKPLKWKSENHDETRQCTRCKCTIASVSPFVQCEPCREKKRDEAARWKKRKAEREVEASAVKRPKKDTDSETKPQKMIADIARMIQYQDFTTLLDALLASPLRFSGTFSIIKEDDINALNRINAVSKTLKASPVNLKFAVTGDLRQQDHGRTARFVCECDSESFPVASGTQTQTALTGWLQTMPSSSPSTMMTSKCGGKVEISAERDMSHPLGIEGQKICVRITHPSRRE